MDRRDTAIHRISLFQHLRGTRIFIDLETLIEDELLTKEECDQADFGENEEEIDYEKIYNARFKVLKLAYKRAKKNGLMESKAYRTYLEEEKSMACGLCIVYGSERFI